MNKKLILIIAVVIVICVIGAFFILKNTISEEGKDEEPKIVYYSTSVIVDSVTNKMNTNTTKVDSIYPQFKNLESNYNTYINSKILNEVGYAAVYKKAIEGLEDNEIGTFTYYTRYERNNCYDFVSLIISQNIELEGSRATTQKTCYVINAKENKTAGLKDVFRNKTNYLGRIRAEINKQVEEKNIEITGGSGSFVLNDSQPFYIKNEKLYIYYKPGEIAPVALGELEFEMPFELNNGFFE